MTVPVPLLVLGALLIAGLAGWLGVLLVQLRRQRRRAGQVQQDLAAHNQSSHDERLRSIELLCVAALAGDCDLSEACIRIRHLLDYYPGLAGDERLLPIFEMHEEVRGFATHDARKALGARDRLAQDRARADVEARYRIELLASFGVLRERMTQLHGSAYDIDIAVGRPG